MTAERALIALTVLLATLTGAAAGQATDPHMEFFGCQPDAGYPLVFSAGGQWYPIGGVEIANDPEFLGVRFVLPAGLTILDLAIHAGRLRDVPLGEDGLPDPSRFAHGLEALANPYAGHQAVVPIDGHRRGWVVLIVVVVGARGPSGNVLFQMPLFVTTLDGDRVLEIENGCRQHGDNGVGNGEDSQPPGNPPVNDGPGTGPGNPGQKKNKK